MTSTRGAGLLTAASLALLAGALPGCPKDQVSLGDDRLLTNDAGPDAGGSVAAGSGGAPHPAGSGGSGGSGGQGGSGFPPPGDLPPAGAPCGGLTMASCPPVQFCLFDVEDQCGDDGQSGHCEWLPACTAEFNPVCGCDGTTYGSACLAAAMGVSARHGGRCSSGGSSGAPCGGPFRCAPGEFCRFSRDSGPCGSPNAPGVCTRAPNSCSREERPVCGCDGVTYKNECFAAMDGGVAARRGGPCDAPSGSGGSSGTDGGMSGRPCGGDQAAVCNGGEYCDLAKGDGCNVANAIGQCRPLATGCTNMFDPVCGCDHETYPNACWAAAFGVSIDRGGEC